MTNELLSVRVLSLQVVMSSTELLSQAGSGQPATSSPAAATAAAPADPGVFAAFRVGEATGSLRCSQLQRGWREPHALVVRTSADVASASFETRVDTMREGTTAAIGFMTRVQHASVAAATQRRSLGDGVVDTDRKDQGGAVDAQEAASVPASLHAARLKLRLPPPSAATAAAFPVNSPPASDFTAEQTRAMLRTRHRQADGPGDSGRVLLRVRVHVASTTAAVAAGPNVKAPLLRAMITAVGFSGASPGLPDGARSSSAAATPQMAETLSEHEGPPLQQSKTPTSASVWLQRTGGVHRGGLIADLPWHLSAASVVAEVDAVQRSDCVKAASDSMQGERGRGAATGIAVPAERQISTLRHLLTVGQVTAEAIATAKRRASPSEPLDSLQLQGE